MKKSTIFISFLILSVFMLTLTIYAAYSFNREITSNNSTSGKISEVSKQIIAYSEVEEPSSSNISTYYELEEKYTQTIDTAPDSTKTYYTTSDNITYTAQSSLESFVTATTYYEKYYLYELTTDTKIDSTKTYYTNTTDENTTIKCFATKANNRSDTYGDAISGVEYRLNQIGFKYEFKNTIDVYVRVFLQFQFLSHKYYNNGKIVDNITTIDKTKFTTAILTTDAYTFDSSTSYLYFKTKVEATSDSNTISFNFNPNFIYELTNSGSYSESIIVDFSYTVDIVQANRAYALWGSDFTTHYGTSSATSSEEE